MPAFREPRHGFRGASCGLTQMPMGERNPDPDSK
jgi:hypothetical protein